ncbi:hypothetical protein F4692_002958 [Nocardioides cavernae]|uniref:GerMN domain-containing protein n=1 Tax=Nocardioides cavernae TaxID=1921566 RepID=A0A7Y9KSR6_9ACTN|nr:Gmad2 immunoglobulin-like domain-containing protein [Nocardioides cavernae]NYE37825.1 hypothetical protein [Nocardioides cavernae]
MNDQLIRDLLHEVADDVEPGDRWGAIQAATAPRGTGRGWWVAGGAGLLAASVVTAFALTTGGAPSSQPAPVGPAPTTASDLPDAMDRLVPVYFVGDTPSGPRLYREFQRGPGPMSAETFAFDAALHGDALDPDYGSSWPAGTSLDTYDFGADLITVSITGDVRDRPAGMSDTDARLALEQLVRTAQGVYGEGRVPVSLLVDGEPVPTVLGVPTAEPLTAGSDLAVLAHVSLSDPSEGREVDNDEPLTVRGVASSFEGNVVTRIERVDDGQVVAEVPATAGSYEDRLFPFRVTLDLSDVPPGDYVVVSRTDDPSGEGMIHVDTRRITVVD